MNAKSEAKVTVASARKYEELLGAGVDGSPYEYATLFKGEGLFARRRAQKRLKLLKLIDLKLRHILDRGEKVYFITQGTTVTTAEHFFVGWISYYLNMRALVFTSSRVIMIHVDSRQRPLELVSQLPYASIASVKSTWNRACSIRLLNREVLNFQYIPRADRKYMVEFLADIVQLTNAPFEQKRGVEQLCPHCFVFVPAHPSECPKCKGHFKSANKAGILSFIFPGVGGWYLGHRVFSVFEMIITFAIWFALVIAPILGIFSLQEALPDREYWIIVGIILLLVHVTGSIMTRHFGLKGHYPVGIAPLPATLPPFMALPKPELNPANKLKLGRTTPPS